MLFQFNHRVDHRRVIEGGPWTIGNHPLILHQLRLGEVPHPVPLIILSFWVQVYDLPIGSFTEGVGRSLGNFLGKFLEYDATNHGAAWKKFMRIRVELDVRNPLKRFKKLRLSNGVTSVVTFKYERLNIFCFIFGRLGHSESYCDVLFDANEDELKNEWGPFLWAPDRRGNSIDAGKWLREGYDEEVWTEPNVGRGVTSETEAGYGDGQSSGERNMKNDIIAVRDDELQKSLVTTPIFEHLSESSCDTNFDGISIEAKKRKRLEKNTNCQLVELEMKIEVLQRDMSTRGREEYRQARTELSGLLVQEEMF
ncbi:hypothetical protein ACS0TY_035197 [Phlomoides rotata]